MSVQMVLLPVFVPVGLTFALLLWMATARGRVWVFVVTRFAHAGIFVTSNNVRQRSLAWFAGVLVLFAMWLYFALKTLLLI